MKRPTTHLELLGRLTEWDPPIHIMGGFAEDALLHGRETRRHEDIDLVVFREDLDLRLDQSRKLGFKDFHLRIATTPSRPLVLGAIERGLNLEIIVFDRAPDGRIYWEKPTHEGPARLYLPPGAFDWAPATIEGFEIRTVSPLALYQIRLGVIDLFGGMREKDVVSQAALRRAFFEGVPEERLQPEIEPMGDVPADWEAPPEAA